MRSLLFKELASFFATITGTVVMLVFLALNALFLWLFPGEFNLLDSGYAQLDGLFLLGPWVFLFLIPALTMRMLADEKRAGTLELLLTKPLTDGQLIMAKYLAGMVLIGLSLLPTVLYFMTIYLLGNPTGNLDVGGILGSYAGLFFLGSAYLGMGLFASSLTDNTIVAFIVALVLSFTFYYGFDQVAEFPFFQGIQLIILQCGINEHYVSISRGVLDTRDVFYFAGLTAAFLLAARFVLQRRNQTQKDGKRFLVALGILILVNIASQWASFRWDLTSEKRYSLSEQTKNLLGKIEEPLLITVYLEGDLPTGFQRLQRETRQMLTEFRTENRLLQFIVVNPSEAADERDRAEVYQQLSSKGLESVQVEVKEKEGFRTLQLFPGIIASYGDKETSASLLQQQLAANPEAQIQASVQNLEYTLATALRQLVIPDKPLIALLDGHGEMTQEKTESLVRELSKSYTLERFNLREFVADSTTELPSIATQQRRLNRYHLIIVAKPTAPFGDLDKWLIDQYLMSGGKILWAVDAVHAEMDSLSYAPEFLAYPVWDHLRLTDQFFSYGVRVNTSLVQDMVSAGVNDRRAVHRWVYFPLLMAQTQHPIARELNALKMEFGTTVDTVVAPGVRKTFLLFSSPYSRRQSTPGVVSLRTMYEEPNPATFREQHLPMAVLLEGTFSSVFKNRLAPLNAEGRALPLLTESKKTQQLIIADGDVLKNQRNLVNPNMPRGEALPLGYDQFTGMQFGNADFVLNAVDYLLDADGLIGVRNREVKLRLLDAPRVAREGSFWKVFNTLFPMGMVFLGGWLYRIYRKRKYASA